MESIMTAPTGKVIAEKTIQMRVRPQVRELIDSAAAALGKTRTEFMIDAARERAIDVLLDQRTFRLDEERGAAFVEALSRPPKPTSALRKLLAAEAPWE
jgi:uncharacterized protein (DUF1778 family)